MAAVRASASRGVVEVALVVVAGFCALSALGGGIGLLAPGAMGVPLSLLDDSPFSSYLWPGIILIAVIGGTQLLAAIALLRRRALGLLAAAVAGFGLQLWIFVQLAIVHGYSVLHGLYFGAGTVELVLVLALLGVLPGVVSPRAPRHESRRRTAAAPRAR